MEHLSHYHQNPYYSGNLATDRKTKYMKIAYELDISSNHLQVSCGQKEPYHKLELRIWVVVHHTGTLFRDDESTDSI